MIRVKITTRGAPPLEHFQGLRPGIAPPTTVTSADIGFAIAMDAELGVCE